MPSATHDVDSLDLLRAKLEGIQRWHRGEDHLFERDLGDGRTIYLRPMLFGNVRLSMGETGDRCFYFEAGWCFHDPDAAWRAAMGWNGDGDPEGWIRHIRSGRRRPDGTPESEYIDP